MLLAGNQLWCRLWWVWLGANNTHIGSLAAFQEQTRQAKHILLTPSHALTCRGSHTSSEQHSVIHDPAIRYHQDLQLLFNKIFNHLTKFETCLRDWAWCQRKKKHRHTLVRLAPTCHLPKLIGRTVASTYQPDIFRQQHKLFHPWGTTENAVLSGWLLSVETILLHICKLPALQVLEARIFCVADLQSTMKAKVSSAKSGLLPL